MSGPDHHTWARVYGSTWQLPWHSQVSCQTGALVHTHRNQTTPVGNQLLHCSLQPVLTLVSHTHTFTITQMCHNAVRHKMQRTLLCVAAATFLSLQPPLQTDCSAWRVQEMLQFIYLHPCSLKYFIDDLLFILSHLLWRQNFCVRYVITTFHKICKSNDFKASFCTSLDHSCVSADFYPKYQQKQH